MATKMIYIRFATIPLFNLLLCAVVFAAPGKPIITGTFSDGESVSISVSSPGEKSTAAPTLWDTFEGGTTGNQIQAQSAIIGAWETGSGSDRVTYSETSPHAGSKSAVHSWDGAHWDANLCLNETAIDTLYIDFWMTIPDWGSSHNSGNFKPWRIWGESDTMDIHAGAGCSTGTPYAVLSVTDSNCGLNEIPSWAPTYPDRNTYHFQIIIKASDGATADGIVQQYVNHTLYGDSSQQTRCSTSRHLSQIRIGHYNNTGSRDGCTIDSAVYAYTDNVYIDYSLARVEIGNNSTYGDCTHREIQIPSAWSNGTPGSITATVNTGSFEIGNTVYLFVVDANNEISPASDPIIISEASTAPRYQGVTFRGMGQ